MSDYLEDFTKRLESGPALLLLGQRYLALDDGLDAFLSEISRKYASESFSDVPTYDRLLESGVTDNSDASLAWMEERCRRLSLPAWASPVSDYAWSGVVTSAIDTIWWSAFRKPWRELQPLFEEKFRPANPRNRLLLHCTFLFGCVNRRDEAGRPPFTRMEWLARRQIAISLLRRLPELITPRGSLVIEGYAGPARLAEARRPDSDPRFT